MNSDTYIMIGSPKINQQIVLEIEKLKAIEDNIPGVIIIHDLKDMSVVYMSKRGQEVLGASLTELRKTGPDWVHKYFNEQESKEYVPLIVEWLRRNDKNEFISFFQQVKTAKSKDWNWYLTSMKIFMQDEQGNPILSIAIANAIDPDHYITDKVQRMLEEKNFRKRNSEVFESLTKREKEILQYVALGKNTPEIATLVHLSDKTVNTHRKNIRKKLRIQSGYDINLFAQAFDLI
jgi:DNA-directed RNA polymerase specialized sigma24 family protein